MNITDADSFGPVPFDPSRLNLHIKGGKRASRVVLFVHGLGGDGYRTWKDFPKFVFEDFEDCDTAIFQYYTAHRRVRMRDLSGMEFVVAQLTNSVEGLASRYEEVHIVCHSLGGMVAQLAIKRFLDNSVVSGGPAPPITRIGSLLLLASPRRGSAFAKIGILFCLPEFRWLLRKSKQNKQIERLFIDRIDGHPGVPRTGDRYWIPRYVGIAGSDVAVDRLSATAGVADVHVLPLSGTHGSIVRPKSSGDPQLVLLHEILASVRENRRQFVRETSYKTGIASSVRPRTALVTQLRTGLNGARWRSVYNSAREDLANADVEVIDVRVANGLEPSLLIAVVDTPRLLASEPSSIRAIEECFADLNSGNAVGGGISTVGQTDSTQAMKRLEDLHTNLGSPANVDLSADDDEHALYTTIMTWLEVFIGRKARRLSGTARSERELDTVGNVRTTPQEIPK